MNPPAASPRPWRAPRCLLLAAFALAGAGGHAETDANGPTESARLTASARAMLAVDPLRGIPLAQRALGLAATPHDKLAAEAILADLLRHRTDYAAARELAQDGLAQATALREERLRGLFFCDLGRIHWNLAEYAAALQAFREAIAIGEQLKDPALLTDAHLGSWVIWFDLGETAAADADLAAAAKSALALGDPQRLADYYRELGNVRAGAHDLAAARAAHVRSREISAAAGQTRGVADADINLAGIELAEGHLDQARSLAETAVAAYERFGLKRYLANAYRQLGEVLLKQGHVAEALDYQNRSLQLAIAFGGHRVMAHSYRELAIANEAAGNLPAALDYGRKLQAETTAIFSDKAREQIALAEAGFDAERNRTQLELLRKDQAVRMAELHGARVERYALLALGLLGACAAAALLSRARLKLAAERRVVEETQAARKAAEEANALKTHLLGIASHDLKSPLGTMVLCAEEIVAQANDPKLTAEIAGDMAGEGRRLLTLVTDLLEVARIESGKLETALQPCDLAEIAIARARAYQKAAAAKDQTLAWALPPTGSATIQGDAKRLAQVFDNLIGNAMKFTPPGGSIQLEVEARDGRALASIRDSGPGLRPEDHARLFQPFQTLSARPTAGESSSGLGLYIAREIVARHAGRLDVKSTPGQGATFTINLPLWHPAPLHGATAS